LRFADGTQSRFSISDSFHCSVFHQ
jgi:hypothetical protein